MADERKTVALRDPLALQSYKPAMLNPYELDNKRFRVTLTDCEGVTSRRDKDRVVVSYPPANSDGYLVVSMESTVFCREGPGIPNVKRHDIEINPSDEQIVITLHKAEKGMWINRDKNGPPGPWDIVRARANQPRQ